MRAADVVDVPENFRFRFEQLCSLAEADGRSEALGAVLTLLQRERERLPDGPAWRQVVYLQQILEGEDFKRSVPRERSRR